MRTSRGGGSGESPNLAPEMNDPAANCTETDTHCINLFFKGIEKGVGSDTW